MRLEILPEIRNRMRNTKSVFVMCGNGGLLSNPDVLLGDSGLGGTLGGRSRGWDQLSKHSASAQLLDTSHWIFSCCISVDYSLSPTTLPNNGATPSSAIKKTSWDLKISS